MKRTTQFVISLVLSITLSGGARAVETTESRLETRIVSLSLFKNGLGFVTREGALPRGDGTLRVDGLPVPVHGTFWAYAPGKPDALRHLVAFPWTAPDTVPASSLAEVIEANLGRNVELRLQGGETLRGRIVSSRSADRGPVSLREGGMFPFLPRPAEPSSLLLIETSGATLAIDRSQVVRIQSADGGLRSTLPRERSGSSLRLSIGGVAAGDRLRLLYLARGIAWAPSYAIDLGDGSRARLTAKAEIINELEPLERVPVNFITGYPNLGFAGVDDPVGMRGDLAAFLNALQRPGGDVQDYRGVAMNQMALGREEASSIGYSTAPPEGQAREGLFFYEQKDVTLAKGERGYYPLFTLDVPCEHVYEFDLNDALTRQASGQTPDPAGRAVGPDVWHSVRLSNTGRVPWTTAPAMVMQGGELISQDVMPYGAPGATSTVRITKALDLRAEVSEVEASRTRDAARFGGWSYDLVELRGRASATSVKDKDITLTVTREVPGEVLASTPPARTETLAKGATQVNPTIRMTWEVPLKAHGRIGIEYRFRYYVRQ